MNFDWASIVGRTGTYPESIHNLLAPCPDAALRDIESKLGKMPALLTDMLRLFNGAELFINDGPLFTLFGVSTVQALSTSEWASDWYIDKFTPKWRASFHRANDWVIGISNYGGIIVIDDNNLIGQWDSAIKSWEFEKMNFENWRKRLISEGQAYLNDL